VFLNVYSNEFDLIESELNQSWSRNFRKQKWGYVESELYIAELPISDVWSYLNVILNLVDLLCVMKAELLLLENFLK
jgi:hypothetical protein